MLVLARGFAGRRSVVAIAGSIGFAAGVAGTPILLQALKGDTPFAIIKILLGGGFLLFLVVSVAALYRSSERSAPADRRARLANSGLCAASVASAAGLAAGAVCACSFAGFQNIFALSLFLAVTAVVVAVLIPVAEKLLPETFVVSPSGLAAAVTAFLLFSSSSLPRLDLFASLTMKVMKFAHDFVHQFFESMLIPDHMFFTSTTWGFIGLLFGNRVGFWGALSIWFAPMVLVIAALALERLPSVAHIRQGAQRRKLMAAAIRARRLRLIVPLCAAIISGGAVYESSFPKVEYWDPKPLTVSANPAGEIIIPRKGEIDLEDGKLHKFLYKQGGKEARFFILKPPGEEVTVDLDACAICKPDGYGQAEGTVICYYCKTLIPLETVGKSGGCNPVPMAFIVKEDGVHIDGVSLINTWSSTVQSTARIKEGGK
jgi:MFS family permease